MPLGAITKEDQPKETDLDFLGQTHKNFFSMNDQHSFHQQKS